jgi:hypothetical protein
MVNQQSLKLVGPDVEDPLAGFEPLLLSTVELLDMYWLALLPALQRVVDEAMHGEMTTNDIYEAIKAGRMYGAVAKNDDGEEPEVALVMILETVAYPQYTVLNIVALGGRELDLFKSKFWEHMCSWAFMNGVRTMQASVSPAMARILKGFGFESVYATVRKSLTEM